MRAAVHTFVHSVNGCDTVDTELSGLPPFCNRKISTVKDFRKAVISMHDSVPYAKWLMAQKSWNRNRQTHIVIAIISNYKNKATGFTMKTFA